MKRPTCQRSASISSRLRRFKKRVWKYQWLMATLRKKRRRRSSRNRKIRVIRSFYKMLRKLQLQCENPYFKVHRDMTRERLPRTCWNTRILWTKICKMWCAMKKSIWARRSEKSRKRPKCWRIGVMIKSIVRQSILLKPVDNSGSPTKERGRCCSRRWIRLPMIPILQRPIRMITSLKSMTLCCWRHLQGRRWIRRVEVSVVIRFHCFINRRRQMLKEVIQIWRLDWWRGMSLSQYWIKYSYNVRLFKLISRLHTDMLNNSRPRARGKVPTSN